MYRTEHVFWFSVVVIGLCESLELNISPGCVNDCTDKVFAVLVSGKNSVNSRIS